MTKRIPPHYKALVEASEKHGREHPVSEPFAWCLRQCGTEMFYIQSPFDLSWAKAQYEAHYGLHRYVGSGLVCFIWDGKELNHVTPDEWVRWIEKRTNDLTTFTFEIRVKLWGREERQFRKERAKTYELARQLVVSWANQRWVDFQVVDSQAA